MIRPNKKYAFDLPTLNDEKRSLVRTGTYPDGNCFIHALLRAIDCSYRKQDSQAMHLSLVGDFRKKIYDWLTTEKFYALGNGEQVRVYFLTELNHLLDEKYSQKDTSTAESGNHNDDFASMYQIIQELIPRKYIDDEILPILKEPERFYVDFLSLCEKRIRDQLQNYNPEKTQAICNLMSKYFIDIFQEAHDRAFQNFKIKLRTMNEFVDSFQMECISNFVNYNLLFIDEKTMDVYHGAKHIVSFDTNRDCVLFLWINENHFEVLGVLEHGNIINRIFKSNDPLIRRIYQKSSGLDTA